MFTRGARRFLTRSKSRFFSLLEEDATVRATVIRERLQERGYASGITILKDYLTEVRPRLHRRLFPWALGHRSHPRVLRT